MPKLEVIMNQQVSELPHIQIANHTVARLFAVIPVPTILKMLSALLSSISVFIIGRSVTAVTNCILATIPLMHPFEWESVFIPYIPSKLHELLESPLPSVFGSSLPRDRMNVTAFIYSIEALGMFESLEKTFNNVERKPAQLPNYDVLLSKLNGVCNEVMSNILRLGSYGEKVYVMSKEHREVEFAEKVMNILKEDLYDVIFNTVNAYIQGHANISLKQFQEEFPQSIQTNDKEFYANLVTSQHFVSWWLKNQGNN